MASASVVGWASMGSTMTSLELYTASTWPGGSGEQRGTDKGLEAVGVVSEGGPGGRSGVSLGSGWVGGSITLSSSRGTWHSGTPVVEGTAHHSVLAGFQHHIAVHELLDSALAVG